MSQTPIDRSIDVAIAFADLHAAVDIGHIDTATAIAKHYNLPLDEVWAPEDDGLEPEPACQAGVDQPPAVMSHAENGEDRAARSPSGSTSRFISAA